MTAFCGVFSFPECTGPMIGIIGMGDLIIPGFVVAYCGAFDAHCRRKSVFKFSYLAIFAYVVGLTVTYLVKVSFQCSFWVQAIVHP